LLEENAPSVINPLILFFTAIPVHLHYIALVLILVVTKLLLFASHETEETIKQRDIIKNYPVTYWYEQPQNMHQGILSSYMHYILDCNTFRFQLASLAIDILLFTLGFYLLFKTIYKKLS